MEGDAERREESIGLVVIVVLAVLAVSSLLVAFSYYCYIRNKVTKHRKCLTKKAAAVKGCQEMVLPVRDKSRTGGDSSRGHYSANSSGSRSGNSGGLTQKEDRRERERDAAAVVQAFACQPQSHKELHVFYFKHLHSATGGFGKANVLGHGSFGSVYKGILPDDRHIAVKLMDPAGKQGEDEFKMEIELLTRLKSPYLLPLIGYCSDRDHRVLVYEYMANGGLQEHLYPSGGSRIDGTSKLDWDTRMNIALEAAKGLEYLHEHVNPPVIHRDFKSSNILLDNNFHAKVSDFGLAKLGSDKIGGHVSTRVLGTQGYVAPEYALTGHLTTKSDVYSYGVVLLELLTGRVPVDMSRPNGECVLVSWALPCLTDREKVAQILDPAMEGNYSMKDVVQVAAIAAMCVQPEADYRPLMADVVQSLVPLVKHKSAARAGGSFPDLHVQKPLTMSDGSMSDH